MRNNWISIFYLLVALSYPLISGCSSISSQLTSSQSIAKEILGSDEVPLIYGGVRVNAKMAEDIFDMASSNNPEVGQAIGIGSMYLIIDLPFSLVADTLLLPYSIYRTCNADDRIPELQ